VHHIKAMTTEFSNLVDARLSLGLTADQLASRLGVAQSTVIRAEQSEIRKSISINTLQRAAEALGLEFEYKFVSKSSNKRLDELERVRQLSPEEKLLKSVELSELASRLRNARKRAR
jgi:transcriptional regulator with XRE-family HTH domain